MSDIIPIDGRVWRRVSRLIDDRYDDPKTHKRIQKIAREYLAGKTCTAISENVGLTAERVRQILRGLGITRRQGGVSLRTGRRLLVQERERLRKLERLARRHYRCSREDVEKVLEEWRALSPAHRRLPHWSHRSPLHRFRVFHASVSRRRSRPVLVTLPEWWRVWMESGQWKNYGRGRRRHHMEVRNPDKPVDARNLVVVSSLERAGGSANPRAPRRKAGGRGARKTRASATGRAGRSRRT